MSCGKKIIFLLSILWTLTGLAKFNCDPALVKFSNNQVILHANNQPQVFLFSNKSTQDFWLVRQFSRQGASAGWDSLLKSQRESALLWSDNRNNFVVACMQTLSNNNAQLNCQNYLKVCALSNATLGKNTQGNFWLVENQRRSKLKAAMAKRGVIFNN